MLLDSINLNFVMGILGLLTVVTAFVSLKMLSGMFKEENISYTN